MSEASKKEPNRVGTVKPHVHVWFLQQKPHRLKPDVVGPFDSYLESQYDDGSCVVRIFDQDYKKWQDPNDLCLYSAVRMPPDRVIPRGQVVWEFPRTRFDLIEELS